MSRALNRDEQRIYDALEAKILDLKGKGVIPSHVVVYRTRFIGFGELHGLPMIRAGYVKPDEAGLLFLIDDVTRPPFQERA